MRAAKVLEKTPPDLQAGTTDRAKLVPVTMGVVLAIFCAATAWAQGASRDITVEAMRSERRVALVIGNSAYPTSPLRNPVNDARAMAQVLRGVGFEVLAHEDLGQKELLRAILAFGDRIREGGVGLFYYAGHGLQVAGRNYMVPVDAAIKAEEEVEVETVDVAKVLARMEAAKNRLNIVVLDACRDNPFGRSFRSTARGLASLDAPAGTLIAYATAPGKLARDGEGPNSLYTGALVRALRLPGLKIEDVFKRVRQEVQRQTRGQQVPWESSSLTGDFMFPLPAATPGTARPEAPPQPLPPIALVPPPEPPRPATGFLVLQGRPPGTTVILDGKEVGKVGLAALRLETNVGTYSLRLEALGHRPREAQIEVKANTEQPIQFELERIIESLRAGTIQRRGRDNAEMVYIPAGTFTMGDTHGDGGSEEKPSHQVTLEAFWIDRTEVTNAQFVRFVQASVYRPQGEWQKYAANKDQHPVVEVTWHDAVAYCKWADKRLPTEAEWEYAARGTDGRKYPWGNTWENSRARFAGNRGRETTAPVGSYPAGASPYGVLDMAGNVWEWGSSLYMPYPYVATDGREDPTASGTHVIRGGSWYGGPGSLRSDGRGWGGPAPRNYALGFRCAQGS